MNNHKYLVGIIAGLLVGMAAVVIVAVQPRQEQPHQPNLGGGDFVTEIRTFDGGDWSNATTSVSYLSTTASTTFSFKSEGAESIDMNLRLTASTTGTKLTWFYEFSNNNIDWYTEDTINVDSTTGTTHGATTTTHYWTPGITATSTKNVTISPTASKYIRLKFGTQVANGALWGELIMKKIVPR